jgi:hypothetical protein
MKRLPIRIAGSLVLALCAAGSAWAHHTAAGIDRSKTVTVEGTVKMFKWANPHSWIEVEVPDGKGGVASWNMEMTAPASLVRAGWKSTTVKPGDKIKAVVNPMIDGTPGGLFVSITLPNGQEMTQRAQAAPRPAAQAPAAP